MKLGKYLVLVGLSFMVACGQPPLTVTLSSSELNPVFGSSVTFTATATPASKIVKLELLEGTIVKKTVNNAANLEQNIVMDKAGKRSFTARVTDSAGVVASSAVVEVDTKLPPAPVVTLKASQTEVFVDGLSTLTASVVASSGVSEVEFFEGTKSLGKDSSVPFELVVTDFTSVGSRVFKAVATDNNGLKGEALTSITVLTSQPTSFQLLTNLSPIPEVFILSPDVVELEAKYEAGVVSKQTKWTLQTSNGSPAPTDGSLGTIVAIPGDPNGLRSSKVRYVPPTFANFNDKSRALVNVNSVQDPNQTVQLGLKSIKKGTQTGINLVQSPVNASSKLNVPLQINLEPVGSVGNIDNTGVWSLPDSSSGTFACVPNFPCAFNTQGQIVTNRVLFTPLKLGAVSIIAGSLHDGAGFKLDLTVVP